jgi:hypothetical protein
MGGRQDHPRTDEGSRTNGATVVAPYIHLADRCPRRSAIVERLAVVGTDNPRHKLDLLGLNRLRASIACQKNRSKKMG